MTAPAAQPAMAVARRPFGVLAALALLMGAVLCLRLPVLPGWPWLWLMVLAGLLLWWKGKRLWWLGPLLSGFGWVGLHAAWTLDAQLPVQWEKRDQVVSGRIVDLPEADERRTRFRLRVDSDAAQPEALRGQLLQLSWHDDFGATEPGPRTQLQAGARWQMTVRLRAPRGLSNPGGFDRERHSLALRIAANGHVRSPETARLQAPPVGINAWRDGMAGRMQADISKPSSRYVRALSIGDTRGLSERDWEILRATGLTHLIAISGFHVGMVAGFIALLGAGVWWLFPRLGRLMPRPLAAGIMALVGAVGYAGVAGFGLPTVRTALMVAVVVLARMWRRPVTVTDSLALAAIVVLVFDPLSILMAGFWLSFAGVAWLVWCLPDTQEVPMLRQFLSAQGVATLGLLPLTAVLFGQASLAGPLANLLAIPWWSLVVIPLALLGTALEVLHAGAGAWAWQAAVWCFDLSWWLFERMAGSRFALWWLPEARWFALPLALLGAFWCLLPRGVPGKWLASLLWLPLLWPDRELPRHGEAELVMLDVGQGLAVLVRTSRHALLYDAGPAVKDGFDAGERVVVPALRALGVGRLDRAVVSHHDNDHAGGFEAVRRVVQVGLTSTPAGSPMPLEETCEAGQSWEWDGVRFRFLHPVPHFPYLGNEASCVLRVETAHGAFLLTGDIGDVVERMLVQREGAALRAEVVLAPHHGSAGSSDPRLISATGARLVLVSSGHDNHFGHPRQDVVQRWERAGAEVLGTADSGAIRVWAGRNGLAVRERRAFRARPWDAVRRHAAATLSYRSMKERPDAPED